MENHKKDCEHGKRQREIELKAAEELEKKKQQEGEDFFEEFVDGLEELEGQCKLSAVCLCCHICLIYKTHDIKMRVSSYLFTQLLLPVIEICRNW